MIVSYIRKACFQIQATGQVAKGKMERWATIDWHLVDLSRVRVAWANSSHVDMDNAQWDWYTSAVASTDVVA
jgi:hypothetical protein